MTVSALATPTIPKQTATAIANRVAKPMEKRPAMKSRASLSFGRSLVIAGVFLAAAFGSAAHADQPDVSAQRLLSSGQDGDPGMKMFTEVIASAFASGFLWGGYAPGKHTYCAQSDIKGSAIMSAFQQFLRDHPGMVGAPYGAAMAATLREAFACTGR